MGSSPIQQATAPVTLEVFREHLERVSSRSVGSIPTWGTIVGGRKTCIN